MNNIRQIKVILYKLKKEFGQPLSIMTIRSINQDLATGQTIMDERVIQIRRAIILDSKINRDFVYDLAFIAANKNFTYGGAFDTSTRQIIVDGADLPRDYEPTLNDRCVHAGERYQFKNLAPTVYNLGYIITAQHLDSQRTENIQELKIGQLAPVEQEITNA